MTKARLPRTTPVNRLRDWDETPPEAVFYHGFWLFPDEVERLREIEEFHRKFGSKPFHKHRLQEKDHETIIDTEGGGQTARVLDPEELERWVNERSHNKKRKT